MADLHDPTARLRPLWEAQARRRQARPATHEESSVPTTPGPAAVRTGWTPTFGADTDPDSDPGLPDRDAGPDDDDEGAPASVDDAGRRRRGPTGRWSELARPWSRWRDRWVPEPDSVRLDPGRRGGALIAVVAVIPLLVAALGWFPGDRGQTVGPSPVAVAAGSAVPLDPAAAGTETGSGSTGTVPAPETDGAVTTTSAPATPVDIVVAVTGAVVRPGVVTLPAGARVADAVAAAGGVRDGTDFTGLNLAARVAAGASIVVGGAGQGIRGDGSAGAGGSGGATGAAGGAATSGAAAAPLDLNTADAAALEALPGVGPVMAANILGWREDHGGFTSVTQLQEISGIGPARYATLSSLVRVG